MLSLFKRRPPAPNISQSREAEERSATESVRQAGFPATPSPHQELRRPEEDALNDPPPGLPPATRSVASIRTTATRRSFFRNPLNRLDKQPTTAHHRDSATTHPRPTSPSFASAGNDNPTKALATRLQGLADDNPTKALATRLQGLADDNPTKALATRLQELAVANEDGLLGEDEYRLLRGQLFAEAAEGSGRNSAANVGAGGPRAPPRSGGNPTPDPPPIPLTSHVAPSRPRSILSSTSTSLPRRRTSIASIFGRDTPVSTSESGAATIHETAAFSIHSVDSGEGIYRSESPFKARAPSSIALSKSSLSTRTPTLASSVRHQLPPLPSSMDSFLFSVARREQTAAEVREEIEEIEREWRRMEGMWRGLEVSAMGRWESAVGADLVRRVQVENAKFIKKEEKEEQAEVPKRHSILFGRDGNREARQNSFANLTTSLSTLPPPVIPSLILFQDPPPPILCFKFSPDQTLATKSLRNEARDISERRRATSAKYERRLEFLRAKMRAALIREKLRR